MNHDFSRSNRCRYCMANIHLAPDECEGNSGAYEDYLYEISKD